MKFTLEQFKNFITIIPIDCIEHIFKFISKSQKITLSRDFMNREISSELTIRKIIHYRQFVKWSKIFNPKSIERVIFSLEDNTVYPSCFIEYMPPCVKTVIIEKIKVSCYGLEYINLSDTVETLVLKNTSAYVNSLPLKLKHLILESDFRGVISFFHQSYYMIDDTHTLESLVLKGYCCCVQRFITRMPEYIKHLAVYPSFKTEIIRWPTQIDNLQIVPEE